MRVMKRPGQMFAELEVTRHIMTKNMWEYYLEEPDENGIAFGVVMGFDTDLHRAYDQDKLGWKYEELECGDPGTQPLLNCNPVNPGESSTIQRLLSTAEEGAARNLEERPHEI